MAEQRPFSDAAAVSATMGCVWFGVQAALSVWAATAVIQDGRNAVPWFGIIWMGLWPWLFASLPGTVFGVIALDSTRRGSFANRGRWAAWAGLILCGSGLVNVFVLVVAWSFDVIP